MAFEGSSKRYKCWECQRDYTWFALMDRDMISAEPDTRTAAASSSWEIIEVGKGSGRHHQGTASQGKEVPMRFPPAQEDQEKYRACKVCVDCVLKDRIKQWDQRPAHLRAEIPDWATPQGVRRDLKMRNKGRLWNMAGQHINAAKLEIKDGSGLESGLKGHRRKKAIMDRAYLLAQALLNSLRSGSLLAAFRAAGSRMLEDNETGLHYLNAYEEAMLDEDDESAQNCLDCAEAEMAMTTDYQTCSEYGAQQAEMLKALDFIDAYGEGLRIYNVCRAKTRYNSKQDKMCSCGLAFPNKLWKKKFPDKPSSWRFVCEVDWTALIEAQLKAPDDKLLRGWVEDMHKEYGEPEAWPKIGCRSEFKAYKKGFSMVAEIKCPDGRWTAFSADRLPPQLDDEIKRVQAAFYLAGKKLNAEELRDIIPVSFPMTNRCKGFPFIAYYPVEDWDEQQLPRFSQKSWCKLAMMTAKKDMKNLHQCFEVAKKISDALSSL